VGSKVGPRGAGISIGLANVKGKEGENGEARGDSVLENGRGKRILPGTSCEGRFTDPLVK